MIGNHVCLRERAEKQPVTLPFRGAAMVWMGFGHLFAGDPRSAREAFERGTTYRPEAKLYRGWVDAGRGAIDAEAALRGWRGLSAEATDAERLRRGMIVALALRGTSDMGPLRDDLLALAERLPNRYGDLLWLCVDGEGERAVDPLAEVAVRALTLQSPPEEP